MAAYLRLRLRLLVLVVELRRAAPRRLGHVLRCAARVAAAGTRTRTGAGGATALEPLLLGPQLPLQDAELGVGVEGMG